MNRAWIMIAALALVACGRQAERELDGRWEVQQIAGASLGEGVEIWIEFDEVAEIVNGYSGCKPFSASLATFERTVAFGPINQAPGECQSPEAATDEARLLIALPAVQRYARRGNSLELLQLAQGSETLIRLRRVDGAAG